ncbi:MAG: alpha-N-acetylglucosaminidase [Bacteroidales bacterium]|nr:alpha-N-acetylglucosaminidase [Bacteroidales bacterium]
MRKKSLFFITLLCMALLAGCSDGKAGYNEGDSEAKAAAALADRVIPSASSHFTFRTLYADADDFFTVAARDGKVLIRGNNANSMAVGLNWYLRHYCNVDIGWFKEKVRVPRRLPDVEDGDCMQNARVDKRFFLNYCTFGYTMPWWGWDEWEHFIDWMALNGVNLPLAITGQESIWYKIWTEMGLSDEEVRAYFTGPAHLPWHRMQNIDRWGGPLPQSWLDSQLELQKKIVARERQLDMKPVLPAFAGHVPRELARLYPDAPMTQLEAWSGYQDEYACTFLDPMSDLYTEIQKKFVEKETEIYGTDHIYGIDIFNELMPPSWEPDYLGRVSRQVYESLAEADPDATWLQMGWLFYNERQYWTPDRVEAYLTSVPKDRQILLDYYCERQEVWKRTDSFYGVPFIWCYLGNFGGNTMMAGNVRLVCDSLENALAKAGENLQGIGSTLEGFDCNPFMYEYVLEKAWEPAEGGEPLHCNLPGWATAMASWRAGSTDSCAIAAWKLLFKKVYGGPSRPGQSSLVTIRPTFGKYRTYYARPKTDYSDADLLEALELLLKADASGAAYSFDVANLARQLLANLYLTVFADYEEAFKAKEREKMASLEKELVGIIDDLELITGTQRDFLLGKWIEDARAWGATPEEADYFESNARNLLTTWSGEDMLLNDYASRQWNGLLSSFYKVRWTMFFDAVNAALDAGEEFDEDHYQAYWKDVTAFEGKWWRERLGTFPSKPSGDAKKIAKAICGKYGPKVRE